MITHAIELMAAGSTQAETLLHEEQSKIGGICIEELHRLTYAQILSSHALTWNVGCHFLELMFFPLSIWFPQLLSI